MNYTEQMENGGFKSDHYDRNGKPAGSSYKGWFGTTDTELDE